MKTHIRVYFQLTISALLFWVAPTLLVAQETSAIFSKGNDYYAKGKYTQAIEHYLTISKTGKTSADLHYNLANGYYKIDQNAKAILHYEKALKLDPAHEDAKFNLKLAQAKTVDKITPLPELFYNRWWHQWVQLISFDGWAQWSIAALILFLVALALFMRASTERVRMVYFALSIILCISFALSFGSSWSGYQKYKNQNYAIVVTPSTYVKSSPSPQGLDLFILHEGAKGKITDQIGKWFRILMADGNEGWVQNETIEMI